MSALGIVLRAAVPMLRITYADLPTYRLREIAVDCADRLAHSGDLLQFKTRTGNMAGAFNLLARMVACQSLLDPKMNWQDVITQLEQAEAEAFCQGNTTG